MDLPCSSHSSEHCCSASGPAGQSSSPLLLQHFRVWNYCQLLWLFLGSHTKGECLDRQGYLPLAGLKPTFPGSLTHDPGQYFHTTERLHLYCFAIIRHCLWPMALEVDSGAPLEWHCQDMLYFVPALVHLWRAVQIGLRLKWTSPPFSDLSTVAHIHLHLGISDIDPSDRVVKGLL